MGPVWVVSGIALMLFVREFVRMPKAIPVTYEAALESAKLMKDWGAWMTTVSTAVIGANGFLLTSVNASFAPEALTRDRWWAFSSVLLFGLSIVVAAWVLGSLPSVVSRLNQSRASTANDIYEMRFLSFVPVRVGAIAGLQHVLFVLGLYCFALYVVGAPRCIRLCGPPGRASPHLSGMEIRHRPLRGAHVQPSITAPQRHRAYPSATGGRMTKPKTPPKTKRPKQPTAKELKEDIEFLMALKAMPPEKLGKLAPMLEAATAAHEKMLALEKEVARAEEAMAAAKKKVHESHMAMCDARMAAILSSGPGEYDLDDDEPSPRGEGAGGGSPTLH